MKMKNQWIALSMAGVLVLSSAPAMGFSFEPQSKSSQHRKSKQNEWKNIGIASGAAAILGLLGKNGTVATLGTVGALYSAYRYEEDRKSSKKEDRRRAELYSHRSINVDGHKYRRTTVKKNGKNYYQFVRA